MNKCYLYYRGIMSVSRRLNSSVLLRKFFNELRVRCSPFHFYFFLLLTFVASLDVYMFELKYE